LINSTLKKSHVCSSDLFWSIKLINLNDWVFALNGVYLIKGK